MNLVSYEFVACQASNKGVLILSEVIKLSIYLVLFMIIS
jgi:trehalose-6-phosphate synthase